ncbi:MAG: aspartate kinase [Candidatus Saganbacteria bacterium]|nr:aspartate kinase [Candidatus Saganbacteria bacterium]
MPIVVQKYGGTSVGSAEKIKNVAKRVVKTKKAGNDVVVIVSAMGHTTDELISLLKQITSDPDPREYDMLISTGEQVSAALLASAIIELGEKAISLTGGQAGVITEDIPSKARIKDVKFQRLKKEIAEGKIVVVTGFQGVDSKGDITTIGRGGSDTSAVVIAAALKADVCEIYTDVDGIYTADPRIVPDAKKLDRIAHEEILELASAGAGVMHPRSVECGKIYGINIHVRSSLNENEGTMITTLSPKEVKEMEKRGLVTGVAHDENVAKIGVLQVPDKPGIASKIFTALAESNISVDMIIQSIHGGNVADMAFTVAHSDLKKALEVVNGVAKKIGAKEVVSDDSVAKISLVGIGMVGAPGVAAKMFESLAKNDINIQMISTSEIRISCVVDEKLAKKAVQVLHEAFELSK